MKLIIFLIGLLLNINFSTSDNLRTCTALIKQSDRVDYESLEDIKITNDGVKSVELHLLLSDQSLFLNFKVNGGGKCIDDNDQMTLMFTDRTGLTMVNDNSFNCDGVYTQHFGESFGKKKELKKLMTKDIRSLRITTDAEAVEVSLSAIEAEKIRENHSMPGGKNVIPMSQSLSEKQVALQSSMQFDIPKRMRYLLIITGIVGVIIVVMEGLISGKVELDKLVHFVGYSMISLVLVLGLRPIWMIPSLVALWGVSVAAEYIQRMFGRSFEIEDMIANGMGVAFGLVLGLAIRFIYSYIRKELAFSHVRKNLVKFNPGEQVLRQGDELNKFYLIRKGKVSIYRTLENEKKLLGTAGPGETIGAIGLILGQPQFTDIVADEETEIYGMDLGELMESAGGREQPVSLLLSQAADYIVKQNSQIMEMTGKKQ